MRLLWNVLSVMAVANLLALLGFVAWLKTSDRLDAERVREVRQVFVQTASERKAAEEAAAFRAEAEKKVAEEKAREGTPPMTSSEALDLKLRLSQLDEARLEAMRREVAILQDTLRRERNALRADREAFTKEKDEFERARQVVAQTEGNAQFRKTLATYESLKADKAKLALQQLIDQKQIDQVVAYLNAMQERTRTRVVDEFLKDDPKVAADLLERLRTRGMIARGPEGSNG